MEISIVNPCYASGWLMIWRNVWAQSQLLEANKLLSSGWILLNVLNR